MRGPVILFLIPSCSYFHQWLSLAHLGTQWQIWCHCLQICSWRSYWQLEIGLGWGYLHQSNGLVLYPSGSSPPMEQIYQHGTALIFGLVSHKGLYFPIHRVYLIFYFCLLVKSQFKLQFLDWGQSIHFCLSHRFRPCAD